MKLWIIVSTTAAIAIAAAACGRHQEAASSAPASGVAATAAAPSASAETTGAAALPAAAAAAAAAAEPRIPPCSLISAADVGAIVGKSVVSESNGEGCVYALDRSVQEQPAAAAPGSAKAGSLPDMMGALGKGGGLKMPAGIADQLQITLIFVRDAKSEDAVRSVYARTGETVRGALQPVQPEARLGAVIRTGDEITGVGDWAFATNVASVNMGFGFSSRGRILEAKRGPWHVTLSAVVGPDPGADALDRQLGGIARAAFAKLPA